ncbi:probable G-protein coupled receptor 88 [Alosa alosa]|uniref:probable G-protein coupled receptor 88 n=1 Tax=Alosa alosa TaxID=278164 RepID=UPI0020154228|nr:probable G-protein coupled receptor 88 [Alosa alosa]
MANESEQLVECTMARGSRLCLATLYTFMGVAGAVLNLMVVYLVMTFKKLRTASNAFIVNGCVANLLVCAFWMPHEAVILSTGSSLSPGYQAFKEALLFLGITVSLLSHSLIAVNRYVLITKVPATYQSLYQRRNTEWMISGSWLISVGCLVPWLTTSGYPTEGCASTHSASASSIAGTSVLANSFACATLACTVTAQTAIVLYCYFKIFRRVQISVKRVSILNFQIVNNLPYSFPRKDKRLGLYMLAVCFVFVVTTEPMLWALVARLFVQVPAALWTPLWVVFCTLFVTNPFLYTWKNEEFRKSLRSVMRWDFWRGSVVGIEPINISTISHILPRQNSRRAFLGDMN